MDTCTISCTESEQEKFYKIGKTRRGAKNLSCPESEQEEVYKIMEQRRGANKLVEILTNLEGFLQEFVFLRKEASNI